MTLLDRAPTETSAPDTDLGPTGTPRLWGWVLALASATGIVSGSITIVDKISLLKEPAAGSFCDVSAQVGCTPVLLSWQSSVLGPPNALLGVLMFAVLGTSGAVAASGGRLARGFRLSMVGLSVFFALFLTWYMQQVAYSIGSLCPFCTVCAAAVLMSVLATSRMAADDNGNAAERALATMARRRSDVVVVVAWGVLIAAMLFTGIWM